MPDGACRNALHVLHFSTIFLSPLLGRSERLCKARAEAKFTWIMPSRSQRCIYMKGFSPRFFCPRISLIFVQASAEGKFTWTMPSAAENVKKFTRITKRLDNGDLRSHEFSLIKALYLRFSAALGNMSTLYFLTFSAALGKARTSSALLSLARKFALRFSAALGNMSTLYCSRLRENS